MTKIQIFKQIVLKFCPDGKAIVDPRFALANREKLEFEIYLEFGIWNLVLT